MWIPVMAMIGVAGELRAQDTEARAVDAHAATVASKPTRKPDQVITDDPIALLAVRREESSDNSGIRPEPSSLGARADRRPVDAGAKKAADIASLEKQIRERRSRIVLLMRLFVDDEKTFVIDPTNSDVDTAVKERRRYEQDELRWETAELAKLNVRLEELKQGL